jgi:UBX domain-containing protein 1
VAVKKENKASAGFRSNVATMSSVRGEEDNSEEKGQAYYAGGSEHSGQQVLGPPRKKNPIKDVITEAFRQAQSGNLEQFDPHQDSSSGEPNFRSFAGTGYRLGQTDNDTETVASSSTTRKKPEYDTVTVKVYRQGFTVDDGDIRSYEDPRNREFFESITRNEIPAELRKQGKSMVHVNVEDHLSEDYVKRVPKFKAFAGSGHTLGSPTPPTSEDATVPNMAAAAATSSESVTSTKEDNEARAASALNLNQSEPTTMVSIRLADGSRISSRFNLTHTVQDIRQYIATARPEYTGRPFLLLTTFPNKELVNPADTIQQAGLQNAAILQRLK